jgi:hypothetical protein
MARPTKLGLVFEGAEAEEFLQNENSTVFTSKQLAFSHEKTSRKQDGMITHIPPLILSSPSILLD